MSKINTHATAYQITLDDTIADLSLRRIIDPDLSANSPENREWVLHISSSGQANMPSSPEKALGHDFYDALQAAEKILDRWNILKAAWENAYYENEKFHAWVKELRA